MNEAESTPSPNRFWRKFGILSAALKASAAAELPRWWAKTRSRTRPANRLSRMPVATRAEPLRRLFVDVGAARPGRWIIEPSGGEAGPWTGAPHLLSSSLNARGDFSRVQG